jgi:uncharacterized protein YceK
MRRTVVVLSVGALLLTGCASVSHGTIERSASSPTASVVTAALATRTAGTARLALEARTLGADPVALRLTGTVALDGSKADLVATLPSGSLGEGAGAVGVHELLIDGRAYLKVEGVDLLPAVWVSADLGASNGDNPLASLATSGGVEQILASLREVGSVTRVGRQDVGAVATTKYHATVDATSFLADLPQIPGLDLGAVRKAASVPVDLWVDDQGRIVKVALTLGAADAGASVVLDLGDFGAPLDVAAPSSSLDLSGLLGG